MSSSRNDDNGISADAGIGCAVFYGIGGAAAVALGGAVSGFVSKIFTHLFDLQGC